MPPFPHFGETLAFISTLMWATCVILFRIAGYTVSPLALNLFKDVLGTVLLVITLIATHSL